MKNGVLCVYNIQTTQKGEKSMTPKKVTLTNEETRDAKKLSDIFSDLSDIGKSMAISYLSALRDKELADQKAG